MTRRAAQLLLASVASAAVTLGAAAAQVPAVAAHGFLLLDSAAHVSANARSGTDAGEFMLGQQLARIELAMAPDDADSAAMVKLDVSHDAVTDRADVELREGYVDWRKGRLDLRAGRQVLTWGLGDLVFVNDLFPKDYESFFLGRPIEYLKVPSDALRASLALRSVSVDLVAIPFFASDRQPSRERFVFGFDPFASIGTGPARQPEASLGNTELAARLYGSSGGTELALYGFHGFFHSAAERPDSLPVPTTLSRFYPRLRAFGASAQRSALGGVVSVEGAVHESPDDPQGRDGAVPNSSVRWLVGYQREVATDFTMGLQHVSELMLDHEHYRQALPAGFPETARYRQTATIRATRLLDRQTTKLSLFTFLGLTERDFLIVPEAERKLSDQLTVAAGANLFGGRHGWTTFGALESSSNIYLRVQYGF